MAAPVEQNVEELLEEAKDRWLKAREILKIFENRERLQILSSRPQRPPSGSFFAIELQRLKEFRKDGYVWKKKNGGKTIQEYHVYLKVEKINQLKCSYAHLETNGNFGRRIYRKFETNADIALFHYREDEKHRKKTTKVPGDGMPHCGHEFQNRPSSQETEYDFSPNPGPYELPETEKSADQVSERNQNNLKRVRDETTDVYPDRQTTHTNSLSNIQGHGGSGDGKRDNQNLSFQQANENGLPPNHNTVHKSEFVEQFSDGSFSIVDLSNSFGDTTSKSLHGRYNYLLSLSCPNRKTEIPLTEKFQLWFSKLPKNIDDFTVLDVQVIHLTAALDCKLDLERIIDEANMNINLHDRNGFTALHCAAKFGRTDTVKLLISKGATPGLPSFPGGKTPADLAYAAGHRGIGDYLKNEEIRKLAQGCSSGVASDGCNGLSQTTNKSNLSNIQGNAEFTGSTQVHSINQLLLPPISTDTRNQNNIGNFSELAQSEMQMEEDRFHNTIYSAGDGIQIPPSPLTDLDFFLSELENTCELSKAVGPFIHT